jgi:hypothetical protein
MIKPINRIYYIQAHLPGNGLSTVRSTDQYLPAIYQKMLTESDAQLQEIWSVLHSHVQRSLFQRKIAKIPGGYLTLHRITDIMNFQAHLS